MSLEFGVGIKTWRDIWKHEAGMEERKERHQVIEWRQKTSVKHESIPGSLTGTIGAKIEPYADNGGPLQ